MGPAQIETAPAQGRRYEHLGRHQCNRGLWRTLVHAFKPETEIIFAWWRLRQAPRPTDLPFDAEA